MINLHQSYLFLWTSMFLSISEIFLLSFIPSFYCASANVNFVLPVNKPNVLLLCLSTFLLAFVLNHILPLFHLVLSRSLPCSSTAQEFTDKQFFKKMFPLFQKFHKSLSFLGSFFTQIRPCNGLWFSP